MDDVLLGGFGALAGQAGVEGQRAVGAGHAADAEAADGGQGVGQDGSQGLGHGLQLGAVVAQGGVDVVAVDGELQARFALPVGHLGADGELGFHPADVEGGADDGGKVQGVQPGAFAASVGADDGYDAGGVDACGQAEGLGVGQAEGFAGVVAAGAPCGVGVLVAFEALAAVELLAIDGRVYDEGRAFLADGVSGQDLGGDDEAGALREVVGGDAEGEVHVHAALGVGGQLGALRVGGDGLRDGGGAVCGASAQQACGGGCCGRQYQERKNGMLLFHDSIVLGS